MKKSIILYLMFSLLLLSCEADYIEDIQEVSNESDEISSKNGSWNYTLWPDDPAIMRNNQRFVVQVFQHPNFRGASRTYITTGNSYGNIFFEKIRYNDELSYTMGEWDGEEPALKGQISSMIIGPNVSVTAIFDKSWEAEYDWENYRSTPRYISNMPSNVEFSRCDFYDESTYDCSNYTASGDNRMVALGFATRSSGAGSDFIGYAYQHNNYRGERIPIFDNQDLRLSSIRWNDRISSMKRREGYNVDIPLIFDSGGTSSYMNRIIDQTSDINTGVAWTRNWNVGNKFMFLEDKVDRIITNNCRD